LRHGQKFLQVKISAGSKPGRLHTKITTLFEISRQDCMEFLPAPAQFGTSAHRLDRKPKGRAAVECSIAKTVADAAGLPADRVCRDFNHAPRRISAATVQRPAILRKSWQPPRRRHKSLCSVLPFAPRNRDAKTIGAGL
jgi:hypothetical protein